jgi:predicted nuclease of predicted toxin-antitoxin system
MKLLLDECLPVALKASFERFGYQCDTVREAGLASKKNGELLAIAEGKWEVLVTNDREMKFQQNLKGRNISMLILCAKSNRLEDLLPLLPRCESALLQITSGSIVEIRAS